MSPWLLALFFGLLAVVVTWPLSLHLSTRVIGPFYGDNLEYVWKIWWVEHALLDLGRSPLIQPDIYYPYGYPLAYGEITPSHTYLGLPITALLGPVATYNLSILVSFVLSGLVTYLLVRELTGSEAAGLVSGVIFGFCPYRMARIAGNLPLVDTQWLPLFFLFVERFVRRRRWHYAAAAGLCYAASALSSWYYAVALALLAPIYLLVRFRPWRDRGWRYWIPGILPFALAAALPILPFLLPYLSVQQAGEARAQLEQTAFWSASLTDFLTPNPRHFLWGEWVQKNLLFYPGGMPYEFILGWGILPTILALYGMRKGRESAVRGWLLWIVAALVFSLGPVFTLFGRIIPLPAPEGLAASVQRALDWLGQHSLAAEPFLPASAGRIVIPLPALFLRWYLPGLAGMRSWGRFAIFATLGVAALAGVGVAAFLREEVERRRVRRPALRRWALTGILAGLIFFEFYTGPQDLITPGPRPVDEWLRDQPGRATIIQMPLLVALSGPQMYYSMHHGQRVATGYGTYFPILFESWYPELFHFPSDDALEVLASWEGGGIKWVLIDEADVPAGDPLWQAIAGQERLQLETDVSGVRVYRVR